MPKVRADAEAASHSDVKVIRTKAKSGGAAGKAGGAPAAKRKGNDKGKVKKDKETAHIKILIF